MSTRWIENTAACGLRFVGFADEIASHAVDHKGWYLDLEIADEVYRGAVWQLPARSGRCVYVAGFTDPYNSGAAMIDCDVILAARDERAQYAFGACWQYGDAPQSQTAAALIADSIAERCADAEQERNRKWHAARQVETLRDDICELRHDHTALIRAIFTGDGDDARGAAIRCSLREQVAGLVSDIRALADTHGDEILTDEFA